MRTNFLLEELLLESRVEEVKRKYPDVAVDIIELLASKDPSGNNKYLEWMVKMKHTRTSNVPQITKYVNLFHENINKLTKENLDEVIRIKNWGWLLTDTSPIAKVFQKIYKSPKDINSYEDFEMFMQILNEIKNVLSKSEIKKLEAKVLYNSDDLLITIPKSHKTSCYYGAGTKWCTTNKESDHYFKKYTSNGTLIYVINKKQPESNIWHKAAFFIDKQGDVSVFDAPDKPHIVIEASKNLANWDIIRDTIVEYLYTNNLKGIDRFYVGQDLVTWYESKGVDIFKELSSEELINKVGLTAVQNLLKKRGVTIFEYFNFNRLLQLFLNDPESGLTSEQATKKIWEGYKSVGINPLSKMFIKQSYADEVIDIVEDDLITLDEFLHLTSDPEFLNSVSGGEIYGMKNIFTIMNMFYGSARPDNFYGSTLDTQLLKLFKNDVDLIFGYAKSIDVNLFMVLDVKAMSVFLKKKYDFKTALELTLKNKKYLKSSLNYYGFDNETIFEHLKNQPKFLEELINDKLLTNLDIEDIIKLVKDPKKAFSLWLKQRYRNDGTIEEILDSGYTLRLEDILKKMGSDINIVFPDIESFKNYIYEITGESVELIEKINTEVLLKSFFKGNFYLLYKAFLEKNSSLSPLYLIKAYEDAPIDDETGLKEKVLSYVFERLNQRKMTTILEREGNKNYVVFEKLRVFEGNFVDNYRFFNDYTRNPEYYINDEMKSINYFDFIIGNKDLVEIIKEFLMVHFRNQKITLSLDWVDDFDFLDVKINDDEGYFSFTLTDETIYDLEDYNIQILIENSPTLTNLKNLSKEIFSDIVKKEVKLDVKNYIDSLFENFFGNGFMEVITDKKKLSNYDFQYTLEVQQNVYRFQYDYLLDDVIAYADAYWEHEDDLPRSVFELLTDLADNGYGRINNDLINTGDIGEFISDWSYSDKTIEEFNEKLYQELSQYNPD